MKANEFIKEIGWFEAGLWLSAADSQNMSWLPTDYGSIDVDELGALLHSEEIIQKLGGLDKAKQILSKAPSNAESYQDVYYFRTKPEFLFHNGFHHWNMTENDGQWFKDRGFYPTSIVDLKQAIADVESCQ